MRHRGRLRPRHPADAHQRLRFAHVDIEPARLARQRAPGVPVMLWLHRRRTVQRQRPASTAHWRSVGPGGHAVLRRLPDRPAPRWLRCPPAAKTCAAASAKSPVATAGLAKRIRDVRVDIDIDHRDTFAHILFDGLSASNPSSWRRSTNPAFPVPVRGRIGRRQVRFQEHLDPRRHPQAREPRPDRLPQGRPGTRFGVLKSQLSSPTAPAFGDRRVAGAALREPGDRRGRQHRVLHRRPVPALRCQPRRSRASWPTTLLRSRVGDEPFVRSVRVNLDAGRVNFYCDISPGEDLLLVRRTGLAQATERDFKAFMNGKPGLPVAGIPNDCILRRLTTTRSSRPRRRRCPEARWPASHLRRDPRPQPTRPSPRCSSSGA